MIRCVVTDLDGTLLNGESISEKNRLALALLKENGISIVLATGRYRDQLSLLDEYECEAIILNGASYVDQNRRTVFEALLEEKQLKDITEIVRNSEIGVIYYTDRGLFAVNEERAREGFSASLADYARSLPADVIPFYENLDEITDEKQLAGCRVYKAEIMDITRQKEVERVRAMLKMTEGLSVTTSVKNNIEINSSRASKKEAVLEMMRRKGYNRDEIAVFGDGDNDIGMYEAADETYAVANAVEEIQQLARYHIPSCEDDGFYYGVLQILGI